MSAHNNSTARYRTILIGLHWLMAALIIAAYASIELKGFFPKGSDPRLLMKSIHYGLGLGVLSLVFLRVWARFFAKIPQHTLTLAQPQQLISRVMHWALYGFMLAMPLLGWLMVSAKGDDIHLFGIQVPALMAENLDWEDRFEELHETLGAVGYWLIGLHAFAGLFHHYVQRDDTLVRMLPWLKR